MKTIAMVTFSAALLLVALPRNVQAHEENEDRQDEQVYEGRGTRVAAGDREVFEHRRRGGGGLERLQNEVDHLNAMLSHVGAVMRRYNADRHTWSEYQHLRAEANQLSLRFRRGEQYYDRSRLRGQIAHMHEELHHLEQELHVPQSQWYRWNS